MNRRLKNSARILGAAAVFGAALYAGPEETLSRDISRAPLWDGETRDPSGLLLNRFGGNPVHGIAATVQHVTDVVHSGTGAFRIDTNRTIPVGEFDYVAVSLTGFGPSDDYIDTRDVTDFEAIAFYIRNDTGSAFSLTFEIKDYRDSNDHRLRRPYELTSQSDWASIRVPLEPLDSQWQVIGSPDLSRTKLFALVIEANRGSPVEGSLYIDDMILVERGGPLDPQTAPMEMLVDRIARRQFRGLWGSRDRETGLAPSISSSADVSALNATAALIKMLPEAAEQGWITRNEADNHVGRIVATLGTVMDNVAAAGNGGFVPPRYIDRVSMTPDFVLEESVVDAAFLFLALYQYKSLTGVPAPIVSSIEALLQRFDFAAFSSEAGWRLAYLYSSEKFTDGSYDGYSGEVWVISLAAHLQTSPQRRVEITENYHSGVHRVRSFLVDPARDHLVHTSSLFRAPFLQWLFSLFVDVSDRGPDTYPDPELRSNPHENAVRYQQEVHARKAQEGRIRFLQPDAGDDGSGARYEQFSCYNNFDDPDLFMPWSVGFSFLADPESAGQALRSHLGNQLHGPLGLADSVRWSSAAERPSNVTARHDFWNLALSTMALVQFRFGGNERLASLPEAASALDLVFAPSTVAGAGPATFGQVFMGPLGDSLSAFTKVNVTNRDSRTCSFEMVFHRGSRSVAGGVLIDGEERTTAAGELSAGGSENFDFSAAQDLIQGTLTFFPAAPCGLDSFSLRATYFVGDFSAPAPNLVEAFSIPAHDGGQRLRPGRCVAIPAGNGPEPQAGILQQLGIALSSAFPGQAAPAGTELVFDLYDRSGIFVGSARRPVDGEHAAFFPLAEFPGAEGFHVLTVCLEGDDPDYQMDVTAILVDSLDGTFQFDAVAFADVFEAGDESPWNRRAQ